MFDDDRGSFSNSFTVSKAESTSRILLYDNSLPWSCTAFETEGSILNTPGKMPPFGGFSP
jgi:hypothetical protein